MGEAVPGVGKCWYRVSPLPEMPFPIHRIQTDRGCSPHLNSNVERSQLTDIQEFNSAIGLDSEDLEEELGSWHHCYNWDRPHGSIGGKTPIERYCELSEHTPFWEEIYRNYYEKKEHIQEANYYRELQVRKLKQSM